MAHQNCSCGIEHDAPTVEEWASYSKHCECGSELNLQDDRELTLELFRRVKVIEDRLGIVDDSYTQVE